VRWVYKDNLIYCSNCNITTERITPYCPWCGKKMENFDTRYCDCYHIEYGIPRCWGTKEKDICSCNGFKRNCNFYKGEKK